MEKVTEDLADRLEAVVVESGPVLTCGASDALHAARKAASPTAPSMLTAREALHLLGQVLDDVHGWPGDAGEPGRAERLNSPRREHFPDAGPM